MTKFEMAQYGSIRTPYWYIWTYFQAIFQFFGKNDISKNKVIKWQNLKWLNMVLEHCLFFSSQLPFTEHTKGSYNLRDPGIWHLITNWVAGKQRHLEIAH